MPREQGEREDDDKSKTPQQTKLVTPALAGLTTLLAASPILSVSPGKEGEVKQEEDGHERKCIRIPDDDGIIIPLHGDSDEEINPERYTDPSLVVVQKTNEQVVEKIKPKKKDNAPKPPKKKNKSDSGSSTQKLVTPTLAGLTTVIAATPIISEPSETSDKAKSNPEVRTFIRNTKDGTIIVPLHGDSDEEINPERYEDPSLLTKQRTDGPVIEEYEPPKTPGGTPRREDLVEEEGNIIEMPDNEKSKLKPAELVVKKSVSKESEATKKSKKKDSSKMVTPMLAGMTTLLAASPILSVSPEKEQSKGKENETEDVHERKFIRIPNENAVIIPLHGDSDEEINPERYDDPSLQGVQKIGEIVEEIKPAKKVKYVESKPSKSGESDKKQTSSPAAKLVTPALAGLTTLLAASPILSVSPKEEHGGEDEQKTEESHERKFIRIPNEEAVIIPLHGDSDEEINPDRYEDPSLQGVQKIGEVVEEIKPAKKVQSMQSKPSKSGESEKKQASSSAAKLVTPALAGLTTLLAASPILSVSPEKEHGEEDEQKPEDVHERKFIRIRDEEAVIIPLHGDSDEEINPDRYEDPTLQGVQKIGEVVEEIKPAKKVKSTESKQSKLVESEKKPTSSSAAKLVTPTLAGMTTLLAASPILSISPEKEHRDEDERKTEESHERKFIRIPNEAGVIIPLHGDSDEEINPDRYEDPTLQGVQKIGEIVVDIKPMKKVKDLEIKPSKKDSKKSQVSESSSASKFVTPTLAGMTTLLAASPILSVSPKDEMGDEGDDEKSDAESKEEIHERKFIRIPDQQGVIIPLHGDSDEEINPERYADLSLQGVQKIGEVVQDITPVRVKTKKEGASEMAKKETESSASAKLVTPMLAGMTTLLAASPILTVSPGKDGVESEIGGEGGAGEEKPLERKVIRMAGGQDVIVPLHGDSDEEIHPERYEDPSLVGIQKIEGPTLEDIKVRPPKAVEPKEKAFKTAKVKAIAATEKATREAAKLVTPMLAGMTTLLASSPLSTVSSKKIEGQKMSELVPESNNDPLMNAEDTSLPEDTVERKFIRIPNQQAVIIPLHGDSDEDLHPDRYEDPDLQGVHSITGSVVEESLAPIKPSRTKTPKIESPKELVLEKPIEVEPVKPIPETAMETMHSKEAVKAEGMVSGVTEKIAIKEKVVEGVNEITAGNSDNVANDSEKAPIKPAKRTKAKAPKEPPKSTTAAPNLPETTFETAAEPVFEQQKEESIDKSNKEVQPARDHEYEPVNPKEPPSPPVGTRLSRADQAERAKKIEVSPTVSALVSVPAPATQSESATAPVAAASKYPDQSAASESKLVTPSLAGITTLLAASPILSTSPQVEEEKKEEVLERKFIKIPNEKAIIIPLHGDSDEELHPERYKDPSLVGTQRIEGPVVEEIKAPPPQAKSPVEEISPPQVKSPVQESKPSPQLKPVEQFKEEEYEPVQHPDDMALDEAQPLSFQDRFKAGAGEIRDKIRNMTVPKISLPDRPKINLPDRSKMKLPDRPQFLKERPQFLKERPQFLKERPQFLKEKPQFLKEKPKFLTQKPKFLTERPKFNLPDRSKFKVPERFKFEKSKKVDKPKIRKPNPSSLRRPLRAAITISSESSHNLFQTLKARTYPRFMSKKKREREKASQLRAAGTSVETESSPPSPPVSSRLFPERYRDIKFADEEPGYGDQDQRMEVQSEEGYEENTAPFHERYVQSTPYITAQGPDGTLKAKIDSSSDIVESDKEQISSGASSMRHRVGVLEEIDSDEFFLRQKGLSREDVDVSRYLSKEIRDAFRSPRNVLAHMDSADSRYTDEYEGEEGSPDLRYRDGPPEPPGRTKNRSESKDSEFNTFPIKPTRRKHSDGDFGSKEVFEKVKKPPRKYRSKSDTRQGSIRSLDQSSRRSILFDDTPQPPSRQKSLRSLTRSRPESATDVRGGSVRRDVARDVETPVRPLRKSRSRGASVDERTSRGADSLPHDYGEYEDEEEEEEIDIEGDEMEEELEEEEPEHAAREHVQVFRTMPVMTDVPGRSSAMDDEEIPGYATVRKPKPPRPPLPPKSRKEQLQSQLHSIKAQGINFFQTFPRRAMKSLNKPRLPVRPLKNYSALGPVRPPRRNRVFREPVYVDGDLQDSQAEGEDLKSYDLKHEYEETRDLQRGEIVARMKGRPLPPPPRPPRRSRDDDSWQSGGEVEEDICGPEEDICEPEEDICEPEEEELPVIPTKPSRREEFLASLRIDVSGDHHQPTREETSQVGATHVQPTIESSQQTSFEMPDVSVSIQTDPIPEGFIVDDRSEGYTRSRSRTTESSVISQIEQRQPGKGPVEEIIQRQDASCLHDPRRLFDPNVIRASEDATEEAPPPLPQRNIPPIPVTIPPIIIPPIPPVQVAFPDKLHLAQLDVDKLNVNELQANSIKVSDIDGVTMQISEIASSSGKLVLNGIELPPDFIKNLVSKIPVPEPPKPIVIEKVIEKPIVVEKVVERVVDRVRETTPQPQLKRILTPPPPIVVQHLAQSAAEVPSPPIQQASTVEQLPKPVTSRTRRTSPTRLVDDSEDELASVITERERKERERLEKEPKQDKTPDSAQESVPRTVPIISEEQPLEPSAMALIKQLLSIWYRNFVSGTGSLVNGINSIFPENDKRRDAQTAAVILIVIIAALILLGIGADQSVHHHHWDYLNPPR